MNIESFVERWENSTLREQQAAQSHFNELCRVLGQPTPTEADPKGEFYTFEEPVAKAQGGRGRADVWYKGHFAWEYKGKLKDLDSAYSQILSYKGALDNPPLLVVCDFLEYRIYPQFVGFSDQPIILRNRDLLDPGKRRMLEWLFTDPNEFQRMREREQHDRDNLTKDLAGKFASLAGQMRKHAGPDGAVWSSERISRFLTRVLFILFAEDVGLLPTVVSKTLLRYIIDLGHSDTSAFREALGELFEAMDGRRSRVMGQKVAWFDGGLFAAGPDEAAGADVLDITVLPGALDTLQSATEAEWERVSPTIFGTLFERALDESKRAQLGAHYTSEADILLVVEPVLMRPLRRQWEAIRAEASPLIEQLVNPDLPAREREPLRARASALYGQMKALLGETTVLDPACGSGNFLYVSLRLLKALEAEVQQVFRPLHGAQEIVTPRQLYGIEKEPFAAMLARVAIWIGYLQWRYEKEGSLKDRLPEPILRMGAEEGEPEHIVNDDAILRLDARGEPYEPAWPPATVIVGNPPFLGGKRLRRELKDAYVDKMFRLYRDRVSPEADLVCYWFEKARAQIEAGKTGRAGLLATNSIRGGVNREVLNRIKQTGDIFMAWSDREWVLDGAAVRVSIVGFDGKMEPVRSLDGAEVTTINADLTSSANVAHSVALQENKGLGFMGITPSGNFRLSTDDVLQMLEAREVNKQVLVRYLNGMDITNRESGTWIVDFTGMRLSEASIYQEPLNYVIANVKPFRDAHKTKKLRDNWWLFEAPRPELRAALRPHHRFCVTPRVSKHRVFVWVGMDYFPDSAVIAFARSDDYFFGVLHSYAHEIWSLRQGTWLGVGNDPRYTPTTTFETFPLPWPPGHEDTASPHHAAISAAAKALHEERHAWLNPPPDAFVGEASLRKRTLTNLYNSLVRVRAGERLPQDDPAGHFAARLAELHDALDAAVLAAYGWHDLEGRLRTPAGDEELLRRLLALNHHRAAGGARASDDAAEPEH